MHRDADNTAQRPCSMSTFGETPLAQRANLQKPFTQLHTTFATFAAKKNHFFEDSQPMKQLYFLFLKKN
jgi:hypothetical protein